MEFSVKMEFDERLHTYIYKVFIEKHEPDGGSCYYLHTLDFTAVKNLYPDEVLTPIDALTALNEHGREDFA